MQTSLILVAQRDNATNKRFVLFTLAVAASNRGFLAIGDWLKAYHDELVRLFQPEQARLPSYSMLRRALLRLDYREYAACLARFFAL